MRGGFKMSAFLIDDTNINRFLGFCYWCNHPFKSELISVLNDAGLFINTEKEQTESGLKMLKMNIQALRYRYKDYKQFFKTSEAVKEYKFFEVEKEDKNIFQVLKSLQCYLYQCTEGNIPNKKLYKKLRLIELKLMSWIIDEMPEYKNSKWQ